MQVLYSQVALSLWLQFFFHYKEAVFWSEPRWSPSPFLYMISELWEEGDIDILFIAEHTIEICSLHFNQWWVLGVTTILCTKKLLW